MKALEKIKKDPRVAHLMRAVARYGNRMGAQFAAAITYFSVLAVIPILMVAFAGVGLTVTAIRPELMDELRQYLVEKVSASGPDMAQAVEAAFNKVQGALQQWGIVAVIGLVAAFYAGAGWVSNLKTAIRAQWRPELEPDQKKRMIVWETLMNLAELLGLLLLGGLSIAASVIGTALNTHILHLLGLDALPGTTFLTWLATFAIAVVSSTLLFLYVFWVLPKHKAPRRQWLLGSIFAGVVLALLLTFIGLIMRLFAGNAAAAAFGPIVVVMLAFNIFAQITLLIAAWIATTNQPAIARRYNEADEPLRGRPGTELAEDHWAQADRDRQHTEEEKEAKEQGRTEAQHACSAERPDSARAAYDRQQARKGLGPVPPPNDPGTMIPGSVAARGVRVSLGAGYAVGAATGVGLGALMGRVIHALANRRR